MSIITIVKTWHLKTDRGVEIIHLKEYYTVEQRNFYLLRDGDKTEEYIRRFYYDHKVTPAEMTKLERECKDCLTLWVGKTISVGAHVYEITTINESKR